MLWPFLLLFNSSCIQSRRRYYWKLVIMCSVFVVECVHVCMWACQHVELLIILITLGEVGEMGTGTNPLCLVFIKLNYTPPSTTIFWLFNNNNCNYKQLFWSCTDNGETFTLQEELVKQLTTQIADLERFVTFLQGLLHLKSEFQILIIHFVHPRIRLLTSTGIWSVRW